MRDEEREDSEEELASKRAIIDNLVLQPDGTLSPEGTEIVDDFRRMTREVVAEVLAGDTAGLSEADIAKYRKLGENFVAEPQDKQPEEPPTETETSGNPLSKEQLETKEAIDKILEKEEEATTVQAKREGEGTTSHTKLVKPMVDALKVMTANNEDELLQLVGSLERRVTLLAKGKYKDEGQYAFGRATREIYETNFSDRDKRALDEAIEAEVERLNRENGGYAFRMVPATVFNEFMYRLIAAKNG